MAKHDKRINPRRRPASGADVKKALSEGIGLGVNHAIKICLYILLDKHNAPAEDVQALAKEMEWLAGHINDGALSWSDVDRVLKENCVEVHVR